MFSFHFDQMSILGGRLFGVHLVHGERPGRAGSAEGFAIGSASGTTGSPSATATAASSAGVVLVHQHGSPLAHGQLFLLPVGLAEYLEVGEHHDRARDEERDRTGDDGVRFVHDEQTVVRVVQHVLLVLVGGVPTCRMETIRLDLFTVLCIIT